MSPLTHSHFFCWALFDAAQGPDRETLGTCLIAAAARLGMPSEMLDLIRNMQSSRLGLYVQEGHEGDQVLLRELIQGQVHSCHAASGYRGSRGDLWLARLFPPPTPECSYQVVFTTPYILRTPELDAWEHYLHRAIRSIGSADPATAYAQFMKYGTSLCFWNEYIFTAFAGHQLEAVFLSGLPPLPRRARGSR